MDLVIELVRPTLELFAAWHESHAEWGDGLHEDGFGLVAGDDVDTPDGFATWIARLTAAEDVCICRWIVDHGSVLGGIALRLYDDAFTRRHGHIGYGIRPSARGRGVASGALEKMLAVARDRGMQKVLAVCAGGNVASARTLVRAGGVRDRQADSDDVRRFWISVVSEDPVPSPTQRT